MNKFKKFMPVLAALLLVFTAALGLASAACAKTVTDMSGAVVTVPDKVTAYADAWFAHNTIAIMLDGAKRMKATSMTPQQSPWMYKVCPQMNGAESMEFGKDFNVEDLLAKKVQVVFGSNGDEHMRKKLNDVGIAFVNCMFTNFDDMTKSISMTAEILGNKPLAQHYNNYLKASIKDVEKRMAGVSAEGRRKILHGTTVYGLIVDGDKTLIDEWIRLAGGVNAPGHDISGNKKEVSFEQILKWDPDIIITGRHGEDRKILQDPKWQVLRAVKNKKVYVNPKGVFTWDRYSVEEALQVRWAAKFLYPERFKDFDLIAAAQRFYERFYRYRISADDVKRMLASEPPAAN